MATTLEHPRSPRELSGAADPAAELLAEVQHGLARHAVEDVAPDDALLVAIECVIEAANVRDLDRPVTAAELAPFDCEILEPLIRRGQAQGAWSGVATASQLALSLRSLIAGLLPLGARDHQGTRPLARRIQTLFLEAAANAG
jgi:hypothetical protein